jgi:hypothetical protein
MERYSTTKEDLRMKTPPVLSGAVLVLAIVALSSFPLPALAEPDNDSPCWMYDPIGGDCTGGGGNGGCKDCVIMNNPYTDDSYCTCATVQNGGYQICNAPSGDPLCENCTLQNEC